MALHQLTRMPLLVAWGRRGPAVVVVDGPLDRPGERAIWYGVFGVPFCVSGMTAQPDTARAALAVAVAQHPGLNEFFGATRLIDLAIGFTLLGGLALTVHHRRTGRGRRDRQRGCTVCA